MGVRWRDNLLRKRDLDPKLPASRHPQVCYALVACGRPDDKPEPNRAFEAEGEAVRDILRQAGCQVTAATGMDGTDATLRAGLGADILHVAVHGEFDPAHPARSGLALSRDGAEVFLSLDELAREAVTAELVLLSGCDTGRVQPLRNQESLGLMSVLLAQRVTAAVLSFWPILGDARAGADAVAPFYRHWLLDGMPKAHALRRAMLAQRDRPVYAWAGYGLLGFGAETYTEHSTRTGKRP